MPRWPDNQNRERLLALRDGDPEISGSTIATKLGISRQRVSQLLAELGLPRGRRGGLGKRESKRTFHNLAPAERANGHASTIASGTCGELAVAIDLFRRGYDVFRSLSASARCDMIAVQRNEP
jgi:biotin operon repressor